MDCGVQLRVMEGHVVARSAHLAPAASSICVLLVCLCSPSVGCTRKTGVFCA